MGINVEQRRIHGEQVLDHYVTVTGENYSMTIRDSVVRVYAADDGAVTITLPSVAEAYGAGIFDIEALDASGSGAVTVQDKSNDAGLTDITLNADNESVSLISTGDRWREIDSNYS